MLQWEWLGGLPPLRRAAVIGAGSWGTAVATMLARAGLEVDLGCRTADQAAQIDAVARQRATTCPGVELPDAINVMRASELELSRHDLVCFAVPAAALPAAVAAHGSAIPRARRRARDVQGPRAAARHAAVARSSPSASARARSARSPAPPTPPTRSATAPRSSSARATPPSAARSPTRSTAAGFDAGYTRDVVGVELAGCAKNAAALAAAAAVARRPERRRRRRRQGLRRGRRARAPRGLAARDVRRPGRRRRPRRHRPRRRLAQPPRRRAARRAACRPADIDAALGQTAEARRRACRCSPQRIAGRRRRRSRAARARRRRSRARSSRRAGPSR